MLSMLFVFVVLYVLCCCCCYCFSCSHKFISLLQTLNYHPSLSQRINMKIILPLSFLLCLHAMTGTSWALENDSAVDTEAGQRILTSKGSKSRRLSSSKSSKSRRLSSSKSSKSRRLSSSKSSKSSRRLGEGAN
jgi:hypothetical protein